MKRIIKTAIVLLGVLACDSPVAPTATPTGDRSTEHNGGCQSDFHFGDNCESVTGEEGSHYRLSHISWKAVGTNRAQFDYTVAMRRSFYGAPIVGQVVNIARIQYGDGTNQVLPFTVQFVDVASDWFIAKATVTKQYNSAGPFTAFSSDCCRIGNTAVWHHLNNRDGNTLIQTVVNFAAAGSAATSLPALVSCPRSGLCQFNVAATAPAGQTIRYRMATAGEMGAGTVQPPGATIDPTTGIYSWNTPNPVHPAGTRPVYSTQVIMESMVGTTVVARSGVDFLIELTNVAVNAPPAFIAPTPADGSVFTANPGQTVTFVVQAADPDALDVITLHGLNHPAGSTFVTAAPSNPASGTFSWTPTVADRGRDVVINFLAQDNRGASASPRSFIIKVPADVSPPDITPTVTGILGTNGWYTSDINVSWLVVDDDSPFTSSGCDATTVTTDTDGVTFTCSATSAGGPASASVTVKRDATKPAVSGSASGTLGNNSWYVSDVEVSWTTSDAMSGIASSTGCTTSNLTSDTNGATYTCTVTDNAGNQASDDVTVKRDATLPAIAYAGNAGTYTVDQQVSITCSASDNLSGVASSTCANVSGPAYTFNLGANTYNATATDNAGNNGAGSTTFTVEVTGASLCALVERFVSHHGIANSLCAKLRAAEASAARGNMTASRNQLDAFINEVSAQSGKSMTAGNATILTTLARAMQ